MLQAFLFAVLLPLGSAKASTPVATKTPVARSEIEALVRRYYRDVAEQPEERKASAAADELLSEDFLFVFGDLEALTRGIEAHKKWLVWHHRAGAGQIWTLEDMIIEKNLAAVRFLMTSRHEAPFVGIPATGKTIKVRGMDLFRVSGGRIAELYRVFDACDVFHQMGAACPPPPPPGTTPTPAP